MINIPPKLNPECWGRRLCEHGLCQDGQENDPSEEQHSCDLAWGWKTLGANVDPNSVKQTAERLRMHFLQLVQSPVSCWLPYFRVEARSLDRGSPAEKLNLEQIQGFAFGVTTLAFIC
jgi:hypothetical protein